MRDDSLRQGVLFPEGFEKPVLAVFDAEQVSSDGGAIFLHRTDRRLGLIDALAACIGDRRNRGRTEHGVVDLLRQRVLGIALGYADGNDAAKVCNDPVMKMCVSKSPASDSRLASQPTLSRFENSVTFKQLESMHGALARTVINACRRRYGRKVARIVIDIDPTDDPTYGGQQLTFFNSFYDNWCYLPLMGFLSFDDHPEQHLFSAMLRPGNASATFCTHDVIEGAVDELKRRFPKAQIVVRLDGAFATPDTFDLLERLRVKYVIGMAKNAVLLRKARRLLFEARSASIDCDRTIALFGHFNYRAGSWPRARRVVVKAEVTRLDDRIPRDNPRFVVTNMNGNAEWMYHFYCARGDAENRIKEMKIDLASGRTSCKQFSANQLRLTMTAAAFVLMQELRLDAEHTDLYRARVETLRWKLLKIGTRVVESVRRIVLHLPAAYPWKDVFARLAVT